jgi:nicotinate-nucleotide adenylyltransferase
MGSDNLHIFRRWHRWVEFAHRVPIAVVQRPGTSLASLHAKPIRRFGLAPTTPKLCTRSAPAIAIIDGKRNAQSSTAIRASERFAEGLVGVIPS